MNQTENKKGTKKLAGFYAALCCCVLVIGVAGYFTEKHTEDSQLVINNETAEVTDEPVLSMDTKDNTSVALSTLPPVIEVTEAPAQSEEATETIAEDYAADNPDLMEGAITVSSEQPAFILPVNGEILEQFTDVLLYNNALGDWRTHGGVDIAAEKGCSVQAAAAGVVEAVYENEMGSCVEISHAGGFVTRYMGLEDVENLTDGKEIQSGEVIGVTGDCRGENVTQPHLHFEMSKDGVLVNPSDFLPHD